MEHDKMERREERQPMERYRDDNSSVAATAWKVVGGAVLVLAAAAVVVSLPDIKRYIKISTM
ncbi:MAG: DUF6893 family small protein [Pyrinomonadaceae bacterium]